jgi:polysaccharide biosynthesis transport protein
MIEPTAAEQAGRGGIQDLIPGVAWFDPADGNGAKPRTTAAQLIDWVVGHLSVSNDGRSLTTIVSCTSDDPKRATRITNAIAGQNLANQVQAKANATANTDEFLHDKLINLQPQLEVSEEAVNSYRRQSGLMIGTNGTSFPPNA